MPAKGAALASFVLFGLAFLASCLLLESVYLGPRRLAKSAADWSEVPCTIVDMGVAVRSLRANSGGSRSGSSGFEPFARYEYAVAGQVYLGEKFWPGNVLCNSPQEAEAALVGFEKGKPAVCYVDPRDPLRSVLVRDYFPGGGALLLVPFVLVLVTGGGMVGVPWAILHSERTRRRWRRTEDSGTDSLSAGPSDASPSRGGLESEKGV
jgi:hypothetical protein